MSVIAGASPPCAIPGTPLARAAHGLDACVHCGFCLQACPTYVNLEDENDSPRGRLVLMHRLLDGDIPLDDPDVGRHLDRCLGCRACETACPSGVPYGELLEATRATMAPVRGIPFVARMVLALFKRTTVLHASLLLRPPLPRHENPPPPRPNPPRPTRLPPGHASVDLSGRSPVQGLQSPQFQSQSQYPVPSTQYCSKAPSRHLP